MQNIIQQINNNIKNSKVYDVINPTKLELAINLSKKLANNIYLKREDQTLIHSFKIRGSYQKIASLNKEAKDSGIITASAGNHAQGVAFSANKLGVKAIIVMNINTPQIKIDAVKNYGVEVVLHGDIFDESQKYALNLAKQKKLTYIPPYDDQDVIAGQGTIAKEIMEQLPSTDMIFVPVGGGGLISGIVSFIKTYHPNIKIIAVEPSETPTLTEALKHNKRVTLDEVGIFADGVAVKKIGNLNFDILKDIIDETILVSNDEMCAAIKDIYNDVRAISEPSGALSTAGAKKYIQQHNIKNKNIVTILSGSNVNFDRLRYIAERADIGENSEMIVAAEIPEVPGSFLNFCHKLSGHNITEFNYRYSSDKKAHIFAGVSVDNNEDKTKLLNDLMTNFKVNDLSDNSIAKTHIRYMVGGRANPENEVLYRFEFPERKGALLKFLSEISGKWNISLFHYRNHGSSYGRVLVGFQAADTTALEKSLLKIGYIFHNESDNIAYKYFL